VALLEDQAVVRDAMTQGLLYLGHEVVAAGSVIELLSGLDGKVPDVLVSDYRLKGGATGRDAVGIVRECYGEQIGAVIITGETDPEVVGAIVDSGLQVLHKPVQLDELQNCLDEIGAGRTTDQGWK
jgi:DNA-binding NtrC family response regulator